MEEVLKNHLNKDEQILWTGAPESFQALDKTHKSKYIVQAVVAAVLSIAVLAAYVMVARSSGLELNIWIFALVLALGIYAGVLPFLDCRKLRDRVKYVVTDQRMFIVNGNDVRPVSLGTIGQARLVKDQDGHSSLVCGREANKLRPTRLRVAAISGAVMDGDRRNCERFVFYAVEDLAGLKASLSQASQGRLALSA